MESKKESKLGGQYLTEKFSALVFVKKKLLLLKIADILSVFKITAVLSWKSKKLIGAKWKNSNALTFTEEKLQI